jgi:hypothetical protein
MTTITFDTLELTDALKQSGIEQKQAEAIVKAIVKAQGELVTRDYLDIKLSTITADLMLLKWMLGLILAANLSLVLKAFF